MIEDLNDSIECSDTKVSISKCTESNCIYILENKNYKIDLCVENRE